jgi:hypothetical protein
MQRVSVHLFSVMVTLQYAGIHARQAKHATRMLAVQSRSAVSTALVARRRGVEEGPEEIVEKGSGVPPLRLPGRHLRGTCTAGMQVWSPLSQTFEGC